MTYGAGLVAARGDLPDLPALVRRLRRRRRRRPAPGSPSASTTSRRSAAEAIWLSPFYRSPMADFGYDVADYCDVDPVFGTLADFDAPARGGPRARHPRGRRLGAEPQLGPAPVVPRVALVRARARSATGTSGATAHRDGGPPNDWLSAVRRPSAARGRSTSATGQWYLHSFMAEQPDLNWDNPEVEAAMHDVLRFWLDRGVDGFRLDAIHKTRQGPAAARQRRRGAPPRRGLGHDPRAPARDPPRGRRVRGPDARRRGRARRTCTASSASSTPATSCTSRTTSSSPSCPGTPTRSARRSTTSRRSPTRPRVAGVVPGQPRPAARREPLRRRQRPRPGAGARGRC